MDTDGADPVMYIRGKFDNMYCRYKNVIQAAALSNSFVQKTGQSIDEFVTDLCQQAEKCDLGDKCERLIGIGWHTGLCSPRTKPKASPDKCQQASTATSFV
ncbi:hypothetical protein HPB51_004631 [Rhipicephalus microplus]|uniref:Uncharacterized protein n=1 Tax=Rhipicephalus microplus TaxID=6941 RepID=A0A9J6DYL0_RHIMP|nr:hypothetical protein HPB51_004631 [Rhipicephalus microplus]